MNIVVKKVRQDGKRSDKIKMYVIIVKRVHVISYCMSAHDGKESNMTNK